MQNVQSEKWHLNSHDFKKQGEQALKWLKPLALLYLGQLYAAIMIKHTLLGADFIPSATTIGGIQLYLINQGFGLFNRLKAE